LRVLGFLPSVSRPACLAGLLGDRNVYSSGSQAVVKLASLAHPAPNSAVPILAVVVAAASVAGRRSWARAAQQDQTCVLIICEPISWVSLRDHLASVGA
jgi:hypothetical protein